MNIIRCKVYDCRDRCLNDGGSVTVCLPLMTNCSVTLSLHIHNSFVYEMFLEDTIM